MSKFVSLSFLALEARDVPTIFWNPWQHADSLTMSFAADGVQYSHQTLGLTSFTSQLFTQLNSTMAPSVWQEEFLRAAYAWTAESNINIGLIPDLGKPFGGEGFLTTDKPATFRIGTSDNAADVVAVSMPNYPLAGTYAGTMVLNNTMTFNVGGINGTYDLYSVALNEFGNMLGLHDNDDAVGAALNGHYGVRTGLLASDVSAVQSLYGPRLVDSFEGSNGNDTSELASTLTPRADSAVTGRTSVVADGDITTGTDVDYYTFTTPVGTTALTIRLGTAGKSLLAGKVEVYNDAGLLIGSTANTNPLQGDPVITLTEIQANATYTVKVMAARSDVFQTGKYQLRVGFDYDPVTETKVDRVQRLESESGANNSEATATILTTTAGFDSHSHYEWSGQLQSASDQDYFQITAPTSGEVMTITVRSESGLATTATVYDSLGNEVAANVLIHGEGGTFTAQVPNAVAGATYVVLLQHQEPTWSVSTGKYAANIDFSQPLATNQSLAAGTADQSSRIAFGIEVQESGAFRFNFSALSENTAAGNWFDIYIYDAQGVQVALLQTEGMASTSTFAVFLKKGLYTVQLKQTDHFSETASLAYDLGYIRLSDPTDPFAPPDPTDLEPLPQPPPPMDEGRMGIVLIPAPIDPWMP